MALKYHSYLYLCHFLSTNIFGYLFGKLCGIRIYLDICLGPVYDIRSSLTRCVVLESVYCTRSVCCTRHCVLYPTLCAVPDTVCCTRHCVLYQTVCVVPDSVCCTRQCVLYPTVCVVSDSVWLYLKVRVYLFNLGPTDLHKCLRKSTPKSSVFHS